MPRFFHLWSNNSWMKIFIREWILPMHSNFELYEQPNISNSYNIVCLPVRGDNQQALARVLAVVKADK